VVLGFLLVIQQTAANPIAGMLPILLMFGILYFVLIMPMQRQKKTQQQMLGALKTGDEVATTGGIVGSILTINGDIVVIRVKPDNIKLQIVRSAVATVISAESKQS
jgi:preprotein translocase subunit YajC